MKRIRRISGFVILMIIVCSVLYYFIPFRLMERLQQYRYDLRHPEEYVISKHDIDLILKKLTVIGYDQLDAEYRKYTKSDQAPYRKLLTGSQYYKVPAAEIFRKIAGNVRISDLLPKDKYYIAAVWGKQKALYWMVNKKILYNLVALQSALESTGFNRDGFWVKSGFRHPRYNEAVFAAKMSRHMKGEAVDMVIEDINKDGWSDDKDKKIVLKLVDETIIGNQGGVGRYPHTSIVHMDVRGHRARWDTY